MKKFVDTEKMTDILEEQLKTGDGTALQFATLSTEIKRLRFTTDIDPNFTGTFDELETYISTVSQASSAQEHIKLNDLNLKRWIDELHLLMHGKAVTIDFNQRKGREI
ncbi:hypothetical protein [Alkalihalobacillus sp. LMS39]|uniref:hypothetical protein n=1 Tax=Alkalihalobacillus sp. LMS39 TaxID=2924032 RepID=UPI001FB4A297|nr:hypothetical protein [Alkalihalobacillus sp. LMS39]UOE93499.1 hypothetical protein MM271_20275 [Alkalihalobacillus sp. LMS39]